jgi:hypothetical protein
LTRVLPLYKSKRRAAFVTTMRESGNGNGSFKRSTAWRKVSVAAIGAASTLTGGRGGAAVTLGVGDGATAETIGPLNSGVGTGTIAPASVGAGGKRRIGLDGELGWMSSAMARLHRSERERVAARQYFVGCAAVKFLMNCIIC